MPCQPNWSQAVSVKQLHKNASHRASKSRLKPEGAKSASVQSMAGMISSRSSSLWLWRWCRAGEGGVVLEVLQQAALEPVAGHHRVVRVVPRQPGLLPQLGILRDKGAPEILALRGPARPFPREPSTIQENREWGSESQRFVPEQFLENLPSGRSSVM